MRMIVLLAVTTALAGCAAPLYDWGHYEEAVWDMHRPGFAPAHEAQVLAKEIHRTLAKGKQVPPGKYALLGYLYYQLGDGKEARACLVCEKELYPESDVFVERMIRRMP